ncbi:MAG: ubiquinone biosynthesis protein UbiE [Rhizobiales bacterium PAR1]|nr:MAG: ubiquinone biosynthesis protein UbiE [Rhizobiales bacterium PAR1]
MSRAAAFWDRMAERYARSPIPDMPAYLHTLERTRSLLKPTDRVLELGCGTGSTALELAKDVQEIVASDVSAKMIAIARQKATDQNITNVRFVVADLVGQPECAETYDAVLAFNLLHLVDDIPAALARIHARVKPGGLFISKTVCLSGEGVPFKVKLIKLVLPIVRAVGFAPAVRFFSVDQMDVWVRDAGFEILEAGNYPASPPRRYLVARKP